MKKLIVFFLLLASITSGFTPVEPIHNGDHGDTTRIKLNTTFTNQIELNANIATNYGHIISLSNYTINAINVNYDSIISLSNHTFEVIDTTISNDVIPRITSVEQYIDTNIVPMIDNNTSNIVALSNSVPVTIASAITNEVVSSTPMVDPCQIDFIEGGYENIYDDNLTTGDDFTSITLHMHLTDPEYINHLELYFSGITPNYKIFYIKTYVLYNGTWWSVSAPEITSSQSDQWVSLPIHSDMIDIHKIQELKVYFRVNTSTDHATLKELRVMPPAGTYMGTPAIIIPHVFDSLSVGSFGSLSAHRDSNKLGWYNGNKWLYTEPFKFDYIEDLSNNVPVTIAKAITNDVTTKIPFSEFLQISDVYNYGTLQNNVADGDLSTKDGYYYYRLCRLNINMVQAHHIGGVYVYITDMENTSLTDNEIGVQNETTGEWIYNSVPDIFDADMNTWIYFPTSISMQDIETSHIRINIGNDSVGWFHIAEIRVVAPPSMYNGTLATIVPHEFGTDDSGAIGGISIINNKFGWYSGAKWLYTEPYQLSAMKYPEFGPISMLLRTEQHKDVYIESTSYTGTLTEASVSILPTPSDHLEGTPLWANKDNDTNIIYFGANTYVSNVTFGNWWWITLSNTGVITQAHSNVPTQLPLINGWTADASDSPNIVHVINKEEKVYANEIALMCSTDNFNSVVWYYTSQATNINGYGIYQNVAAQNTHLYYTDTSSSNGLQWNLVYLYPDNLSLAIGTNTPPTQIMIYPSLDTYTLTNYIKYVWSPDNTSLKWNYILYDPDTGSVEQNEAGEEVWRVIDVTRWNTEQK